MIESVKEYTYKCDFPRNSYILQYNGEKTNMLYTTVIIRTVPIWKSHRQLYIYLGVLLTVFAILNMIIIIMQFQNHILYLFQTFLNLIFSLSKFSDFLDFIATKQYKQF